MSDHSRSAQPPAPEMIRFRDALARSYAQHPPLQSLTAEAARAAAEAVRAPWTRGGPVMQRTSDHRIEAEGLVLRLRVHRPAERVAGMLVYAHGGGWTLFSVDTHDRVMREYAGRAGIAVIGIDYSLAPEARFPRPVDEVAALLRLLAGPQQSDWLGFNPAGLPIAVAGDSAGANLAMAAALTLRDSGQISGLQAILLNYAVVDPDDSRASYRLYDGPEYNLGRAEMRAFWDLYAPEAGQRLDPRAALLRGRLDGLPPTLITIAECDVLCDENLALAEALGRAGVAVSHRVYAGMLHSFLEAVSISPAAARAFDDSAGWLLAQFARRHDATNPGD